MTRQRHQLSASVFVVLRRRDTICLLRRATTGWMDGYLSLPAGGLDAHETIRDAAIREAREEIGITLTPRTLDYAHTLHSLTEGKDWLGHFFVAIEWVGEPRICEPHKHSALIWAPIASLPDDMIPYVRQSLLNIEEGLAYSEYGWGVPASL
ncbi:NUDIX hydrolase [Microvirga puerhi]|uniref:NUDIX domain-containing protein n=1 Tax=Microvirga puerhi TaxID=2876078 RepID=A0ABS7VKQ5_9HYPH|nr:NUDIX domain-containing protein [Microvirga puerhi]MBZ6076079.1 NUDIX domain-containing protein [Microvirga puerhi]